MKDKRQLLAAGLASIVILGAALAPLTATAQSTASIRHREQKKNEWRNLSIGSGALALLGLIGRNGTMTLIGTAGALYSLDRYEKDRKSQSKLERQRAALYSKSSFVKDGHRYVRRAVKKNGKTYYTFVRVS